MKLSFPKFFFVLSGLCLIYFFVIIVYSGIETAYCIVWPLFAVCFGLMGWFARSAGRSKGGMPRVLPTFVFTTFGLFVFLFLLIMSLVVRESRGARQDQDVDYTIVMGARVYSDGISKTLLYRLERANAYYQAHPDTCLVLSGGADHGDAVPEALAMYSYFSREKIPGSRLLMNVKGTSTRDVLRNALGEIEFSTRQRKTPTGPGDSVWAEEYVPSVGIITSDYHMMRALRIAEAQGIANPVAIPARSDRVLFLHQCVRESAAIVKDYLTGNFILNERQLSFN